MQSTLSIFPLPGGNTVLDLIVFAMAKAQFAHARTWGVDGAPALEVITMLSAPVKEQG